MSDDSIEYEGEPDDFLADEQPKEFDVSQWMRILCSQTGVNQNQVPREVMEMISKLESKNEVNKLFFSWHAQFSQSSPLELTDEQRAKFKSILTMENHPEYLNAMRVLNSANSDIAVLHNRILDKLKGMHPYQDKLREMQGNMNMDLWPAIEECAADGWYTLDLASTISSIEAKGGDAKVTFITPKINLSYFNKKAGIEQNVDMGRYKVHWNVRENNLEVSEGEGAIEISGNCHPHVLDGSVCWGNASQVYVQSMKEYAPKKALEALRVILQSYNAESPYRGIEEWVTERENNPMAGAAVTFAVYQDHAWIRESDMPDSWATSNEMDSEEYDDDGEEFISKYRMRVFVKVYAANGQRVPNEENTYYIRLQNGRNVAIDNSDILDWA